MGSEYSFTGPTGSRTAPVDVRQGIELMAGSGPTGRGNSRPPGNPDLNYVPSGAPRSLTEGQRDERQLNDGEISWFEYQFRTLTGITGYGDIAAGVAALAALKLAKVI